MAHLHIMPSGVEDTWTTDLADDTVYVNLILCGLFGAQT